MCSRTSIDVMMSYFLLGLNFETSDLQYLMFSLFFLECSSATFIALLLVSMPVTLAPNLARDSQRIPPPQPISRTLFPFRGLKLLSFKEGKCSVMKFTLILFNLCNGLKGPFKFHHSE